MNEIEVKYIENDTIYSNFTHDDEDIPINVPYTICECIVALIAVIGNAMVIIVFKTERRLRRRTNYYIVALAVADLLVGLLGVPFAILASIGLPNDLYACLFSLSLLIVLCTISIFCLVAVSVDRYWAILHPMAYSRNVRTKTAIGIIGLCWLFGGIVGFLPLFGLHQEWAPEGKCFFVKVMSYDYLVFLYFATIITPSIILVAFYAHIYRVIIRQVRQIVTLNSIDGNSSNRSSSKFKSLSKKSKSNQINGRTMLRVLGAAQKREVKATQNLSIIVLFFVICWIPLYTINCIKAFCSECEIHEKITFFCIILSHLNSALNPLLYAYHLKDFRLALKNFCLKIFGMEAKIQPPLTNRLSMASKQQHRLKSQLEQKSSLQPRIYIDSPIWLRTQQKTDGKNKNFDSTSITSSLNSVHQTITAVATVTAGQNREMWKIIEVPSTAEESSRANTNDIEVDDDDDDDDENNTDIEKKLRSPMMKSEETIENINDYEDDDDNVFISSSAISSNSNTVNRRFSLDGPLNRHYCKKKLFDSQNDFLTELPYFESSFDSDNNITSLQMAHNLSNNNLKTDNDKNIEDYDNSNIFFIESDNKKSPTTALSSLIDQSGDNDNKSFYTKLSSPKILPSSKYLLKSSTSNNSNNLNNNKSINKVNYYNNFNNNINKNDKKRQNSLIKNSLSSENINNLCKPSSLKLVSNFLFPQNSCSNLFSILDNNNLISNTNNYNNNCNSNNINNCNNVKTTANLLKRTLSDS